MNYFKKINNYFYYNFIIMKRTYSDIEENIYVKKVDKINEEIIKEYEISNNDINVSKKFTKKIIAKLNGYLKENNEEHFIAYIGKTFVGYLCYDDKEIKYLFVKKEYRRKGVATKLLDKVKKYHDNYFLECNTNNKNAIKFYNNYFGSTFSFRSKNIFGNKISFAIYVYNT